MNIRPLADRVLILPVPAEEKTIGGIIIPDTAKEKPLQGKVVAVGNGTKDEEMIISVGDQVLYGKYAGTELGPGLRRTEHHVRRTSAGINHKKQLFRQPGKLGCS